MESTFFLNENADTELLLKVEYFFTEIVFLLMFTCKFYFRIYSSETIKDANLRYGK